MTWFSILGTKIYASVLENSWLKYSSVEKIPPSDEDKRPSSFHPVTHVIFDIDGLLLDTENVYYQVFKDIATMYGKQEYSWDVHKKLSGRKETEAGAIFIKELELPITVDEFRTMLGQMQHEGLLNSQLMPGAQKLVLHLKDHNIPMALASGSGTESIDLKFCNRKDFLQCFEHVVSGTSDPEVKEGKPAPDIFLICASRFPDKPDPSNCLVFEDAPNGVVGALKAGMQVVMVPDDKLSKDLTKDATLVINSLDDFKPELFGLPAFPLPETL